MNSRIALLGALALRMFAQQPCQPQSKAQKAAVWLNRARTGNPSASPAPCQASSDSASAQQMGGFADGAVITSFTSPNLLFLSGGRGSGFNGKVMDGGRLIEWQWRPDKNDPTPIVMMNLGALPNGNNYEQLGGTLRFEGMKDGKWYFSDFVTASGVINVSVTRDGTLYTITRVSQLPGNMADAEGNKVAPPEPPPAPPSYKFKPYPKQIEDALHKAEQQQTGSGLKANAHGGTLGVTTNGETVTLALVQDPSDARNLWHAQNDASKAFLIDHFNGNTTVTALLRQGDGSFLSEDGKRLTVFNGVASVK